MMKSILLTIKSKSEIEMFQIYAWSSRIYAVFGLLKLRYHPPLDTGTLAPSPSILVRTRSPLPLDT